MGFLLVGLAARNGRRGKSQLELWAHSVALFLLASKSLTCSKC